MSIKKAVRLISSAADHSTVYTLTNKQELAEKELTQRGCTDIQLAVVQHSDDLNEVMYFDKEGKIVPLEQLEDKSRWDE